MAIIKLIILYLLQTHLKGEYNGTWAEQTIIVRGTEPARTEEAACSAGGGFLLFRFFPLPFSFLFLFFSSFSFLRFSLSSDHFASNKATKTCRVSWNAHKMIDLRSWGMRLSVFWAKHTQHLPLRYHFESTLIFSTQLLDLIYIWYFWFILLSIINFDLNILIEERLNSFKNSSFLLVLN